MSDEGTRDFAIDVPPDRAGNRRRIVVSVPARTERADERVVKEVIAADIPVFVPPPAPPPAGGGHH